MVNRFTKYIGSQFGNPRGIVRKICSIIMNIINKKMYQSIVNNLSNERRILDIGYGNGYLINLIYQKTKANLYGIDISKDMLHIASKRNAKGISCGDIYLSIGNFCNLPFSDNSFDTVTTVNTIYFWENAVIGFKGIHQSTPKQRYSL